MGDDRIFTVHTDDYQGLVLTSAGKKWLMAKSEAVWGDSYEMAWPEGEKWATEYLSSKTWTTTYDIGLRQLKPYTRIPDGRYTPHELGLYMEGVRAIHVGPCIKAIAWPIWELGHAHVDDAEMCISDGRYVLAAEGKADEAVLHEWGHVLVGLETDSPDWCHGPRWVDTVRRLGGNPTIKSDYIYVGEPGEAVA